MATNWTMQHTSGETVKVTPEEFRRYWDMDTCYVWTSDSDSPGFLATLAELYHTVERFRYPDEEYAGFTFHTPQPSEPVRFFSDEARQAMEGELS